MKESAKEKVSRLIAECKMNVQGWRGGKINPSEADKPSVYCYIGDTETGWLWSCAIPTDVFEELSRRGETSGDEAVQNVRDLLGDLLSKVARGSAPSPDKVTGFDWEEQMGALVALYAGTTKAWHQLKGANKVIHFVVLNYATKKDPSKCMLRPFGMLADENIIFHANHIQSVVSQVADMDRVTHPEWFA